MLERKRVEEEGPSSELAGQTKVTILKERTSRGGEEWTKKSKIKEQKIDWKYRRDVKGVA